MACHLNPFQLPVDQHSSLQLTWTTEKCNFDIHWKSHFSTIFPWRSNFSAIFPWKSNENPMNSHENPMNSHENPMNSREIPMNSHENPMNSHEIPMNSHENPMNSHWIPMNSHENPVEPPPQVSPKTKLATGSAPATETAMPVMTWTGQRSNF